MTLTSLSARRVWIEIKLGWIRGGFMPSLSARRVWIEISPASSITVLLLQSLSARRVWIEILPTG